MSDNTSYIIRSYRLRGSVDEEQEYTVLADAWSAFRVFAVAESMERYSRVELIQRDLTVYSDEDSDEDSDLVMAKMEFQVDMPLLIC